MSEQNNEQFKGLLEKVKTLTADSLKKQDEIDRLKYLLGEMSEIPLGLVVILLEKMYEELNNQEVIDRLSEIGVAMKNNTKEAQEEAFNKVDQEVSDLYKSMWVKLGVDGDKGMEALKNIESLIQKSPRQEQLRCRKLLGKLETQESNVTMIAVVGKEKFDEIVKTQNEIQAKWNHCVTVEEKQELVKNIQSAAIVVDKKIQEFMKEKPDEVQQFVEELPAEDRLSLLKMRVIQDIIAGERDQHGHSHNGQPCTGHGHSHQAPPQQHGHSHNGQPCTGHGHGSH